MRSLVWSALVVTLFSPTSVRAAVEPTGVMELSSPGSTLAHKNAAGVYEVRVYDNGPGFRDCRVVNTSGDYACIARVPLQIDGGNSSDPVFLVDASSAAGKHVVADACSGLLLEVSTSIANPTSVGAWSIIKDWLRDENEEVELERPTAVVVHPSGAALLFSEGASITGDAWVARCDPPQPVSPPSGSVVFVDEPWYVPLEDRGVTSFATLIEGGYGESQAHPEATRALTIYQSGAASEVWVVTGAAAGGEGDGGASARFRRYDMSQSNAQGLPPEIGPSWEIPNTLLEDIYPGHGGLGQPIQVAALSDPSGARVLLAGQNGILAFTLDGQCLGPLWLEFDRGIRLAGASSLVGLTQALDGSRVHALFGRGNVDSEGNRGELLAYWDGDSVPSEPTFELRVLNESELDRCLPLARAGGQMRCPSISSALVAAWKGQSIVVEDGVYHDVAYFHGRGLSLSAEHPGSVTLIATDGLPAVGFVSVPSPGADLDRVGDHGGQRVLHLARGRDRRGRHPVRRLRGKGQPKLRGGQLCRSGRRLGGLRSRPVLSDELGPREQPRGPRRGRLGPGRRDRRRQPVRGVHPRHGRRELRCRGLRGARGRDRDGLDGDRLHRRLER